MLMIHLFQKFLKNIFSKPLIVAIIGPTGAGKSRLAIELAKSFKGDVINADSMQIYKGLDITTNKILLSDRLLVKHHMIDIRDPLTQNFTVQDYKTLATKIIGNLLDKGTIPFITGGTNYYIESVLWDFTIDNKNPNKKLDQSFQHSINTLLEKYNIHLDVVDPFQTLCNKDIRNIPTEELYYLLCNIDHERALSLNKFERRKIIRSLQLYETKGEKHSKVLERQKGKITHRKSGKLIFDNTLILWLSCPEEILIKRLEERVYTMINNGLIEELKEFDKLFNNMDDRLNCGVLQNIGYKELSPYIQNGLEDEKLKTVCIKNLINATRKYTKKQNQWILNRFLNRHTDDMPFIYQLNAINDDENYWYPNVYSYAVDIILMHLNNQHSKYSKLNIL